MAIAVECPWRVERGPDWLFVQLDASVAQDERCEELACGVWALLEQHFTYRVVLELDELPRLPKKLLAEIAALHQRVVQQGGVLRLCGWRSSRDARAESLLPDVGLPCYRDRYEAVLGPRPLQPR